MDHIATGDIGGRIRRARVKRGMSLDDAASATKLPAGVLRAIERNAFETLPGGLYRRAYLRTLAREVGLDPDEISADYVAHFQRPVEPCVHLGNASQRMRWSGPGLPASRQLIVTLIVLAVAAAWFAIA